MKAEPGISQSYYDGPEVVDLLTDALTAAGLDPHALSIDDLAALDEFHALGRPATLALAELADVRTDTHVLDVGGGLGGPARVLAQLYGARVTMLDATARFCRAAEMLTRGTGLADRVRILQGDALALPFADATFDLAWTQAVSQNIADKPRLVGEMARVVRPGGRVAMFEILAGPGGGLELPVPWADHAGQSWLVTGDELREVLAQAGLEVLRFNEGADALRAIGQAAQRAPTAREVPGRLGLELLLPDHDARMAGLHANVVAQNIVIAQVVAQRR